MATTATPATGQPAGAGATAKQQFLDAYEKEHVTTMRVLRAFPSDKADLRPDPSCRTARELAWIFVMERGLGTKVFENVFASGAVPRSELAPPPESWDAIVAAFEAAHKDFGDLIRGMSDEELMQSVKFFTGPRTLGDWTRLQFAWFLLCDEIHHRGQLSIYLRIAGGKVPSIYGPSGDEPWT